MNRDEEKIMEDLIKELKDLPLQITEATGSIKQLIAQRDDNVLTEEKKSQQGGLSIIKTLKRSIPTCACCRKVRDDKGYWNGLKNYIRENFEANFTYGMCPECLNITWPEIYN